jgi:hypothetical protein
MEPIRTLYERDPAPVETLPPALAAMYGGGLAFPAGSNTRPWVIANFVATLDGVVSYDLPGQRGGGPISGENEPDHAIMGLLRASADAVIFGAKSLSEDSGHVRTPAFIYPPLAPAYAELRAPGTPHTAARCRRQRERRGRFERTELSPSRAARADRDHCGGSGAAGRANAS